MMELLCLGGAAGEQQGAWAALSVGGCSACRREVLLAHIGSRPVEFLWELKMRRFRLRLNPRQSNELDFGLRVGVAGRPCLLKYCDATLNPKP